MTSPPSASVIVPAYNEENVIGRCIESILLGARPGEFEVIVVCNGCRDATAGRARAFEGQGVRVIETDIASKTNALNLGDAAASAYPRFYVDADIQVTPQALRQVIRVFETNSQIKLSAPKARVDLSRSDLWVRSFYRVWTRLPYFSNSLIGSGVYAFSKEGRARFVEFPDIIADDEYARRMASPEERLSADCEFVITAPRNLSSLVNIQTRARAGTYQLEQRFPELTENRGTTSATSVATIAKTPSMWLDAPIYLGVMFAAKVRAHRKLSGAGVHAWNRDETAREVS